ncbi:hypothetical protein SLA2020_519090 [Shorea laevis]
MVKNHVLISLRQLPLNIRDLQIFAAYEDFNLIPTIIEGLPNIGVPLLEVPIGGKHTANNSILCDMSEFVLDKPPPFIAMLISGDVDFALALNRIGELGYLVIVAILPGVNVSRYLHQAGRYVFD